MNQPTVFPTGVLTTSAKAASPTGQFGAVEGGDTQ